MPLLTAYERTQQIQGRALAFFDNNAALSDPLGYTIKKASNSFNTSIATVAGKTVNNLGVSVQAALAVTNPSRYGIVFNTSLYPVIAAVVAAVAVVVAVAWLNNVGVVTTLAGDTGAAYFDDTGLAARFNDARGVAVLSNGNIVVSDTHNHRIRLVTPAGVVTTLAGSGSPAFADGTGIGASFQNPYGVDVLPNGNIVVADTYNHRIRLVTPAGVVTTLAGSGSPAFADGTGAGASFQYPFGLSILSNGNIVVADAHNHRIRLVTPAGVVTTLAGSGSPAFADGTGAGASFQFPFGVSTLSTGNIVVADTYNHRIRLVTPAGVVTTLAGSTQSFADGTGTAASFNNPYGVAVLPDGNIVVADVNNHRIRQVTPAGVVTTLAGDGAPAFADGTGTGASFNSPQAVAVIPSTNVIVVSSNNRIRLITPTVDPWFSKLAVVTTFAGDGTPALTNGTGVAARFNQPSGVAVLPNGNTVVADTFNHCIRMITPAGVVTTLAGNGTYDFVDGTGAAARFTYPYGLATLANGNIVVADQGNNRIRLITMPGAVVTTLAGDGNGDFLNGTGTGARFNGPMSVAVLPNGNIAVADSVNHRIRLVTPAGVVTTLAGSGSPTFADGTGAGASFKYPYGVAALSNGNVVVADHYNHRIRLITPAGVVTTIAGDSTAGLVNGTGTGARFTYPSGAVELPNGNIVVADNANCSVRLITMPGAVVTTLAGTNTGSFLDATGTAARFSSPWGVAVFPNGTLVLGDFYGHRIRLITPT